MILRQATEADAHPLAVFLATELGDASPRMSPALLRDRIQQGFLRLVHLEEEGKVAAVLGASHIQTDDGPGWFIRLLVPAHDHPDKIRALDAVCLYAMNIGASEGVTVVTSVATNRDQFYYGRDLLGMTPSQQGTNVKTGKPDGTFWQRGHIKAMMQRIFDRRPEWRL